MTHWIWISFDLGVSGDYPGMYTWLDQHEARECGESVAGLFYDHTGDLLADLQKDLATSVAIDPKSRVYVIRLVKGKMRGRFIIGGRRRAPWAGFAASTEPGEDISA